MDLMTALGPLLGGALIGLASALMLVLNGRVAGVSGIVGGMLGFDGTDRGWRTTFVAGLVCGGALMAVLLPTAFRQGGLGYVPTMAIAGLLVGFGARLGSGCTSGHGVCGIGRFSTRGLAATLTFMATGALSVFAMRWL